MIKVYILPVERINNTDIVVGIEYIHGGLLTYDVGRATVIQDATPEEDSALTALAIEVREPTQLEIADFGSLEPELPPDPDAIRAREILAASPAVTALPEMWELLRIYGRRFGYRPQRRR